MAATDRTALNPAHHPRGAAEALFLRGNALPARWQGRSRFVMAETGFGVGSNFLASWDAWRRDVQRCERLFFLSLDAHPVAADDLLRAHADGRWAALAQQLAAQWPPRTPGWHRLDFDDGRLTLLLAIGSPSDVLPQWVAQVDAFLLHGDALCPPADAPPSLAALTRLARPGATAVAAPATPSLRAALQAAGFVAAAAPAADADGAGGADGAGSDPFVARFVPQRNVPPPGRRALAAGAREAVVLGAGIAGACAAAALRRAGLAVRVLDAAAPASGASGNPAGLFHGTVHADDGPHARWNRAAALRCAQWQPQPPQGLLRLSAERAIAAAYDPGFVQALDADAASRAARWQLAEGGLLYPGGGALAPAEWVCTLLADTPVHQAEIAALQALPDGRWRLLDGVGACVAETALLVLAAGHRLPALLDAPLPVQPQRGALSWWLNQPGPQLPVAAGGYVLRSADRLLAGATAAFDDPDLLLREADHAHNRAVAERLLGLAPGSLPPPDGGRVSWRLLAADKLPLVGGLIDPEAPPPHRATQAAQWPRRPGLLVIGALASRGLTWAPLAAELGVALALGEPAPVERSLVDAVDPARFAVRGARLRAQQQ